jgi:effector-binding domain-containing protein
MTNLNRIFCIDFILPLLVISIGHGSSSLAFNNKPIKQKVMLQDTIKKTNVVLEKVLLEPLNILIIRETTGMAALSKVFDADYGELFNFIRKNDLKAGRVMAFYLDFEDPVTLEVGVEVDRVPGKLNGRIESKFVAGGDAIVAHYTGPYEEMETPYNEIKKWLKDNNKEAREFPFEVYINDPSQVKDKYELKTDVYQFLK